MKASMQHKEFQSTEDIYTKIRKLILDNQFQPQQKINQNQLAKEFHVSRTPVIKALHMLEAQGLVDNIPNRGFCIHVPSLREMAELFALRESLEITAACYAAEFGSKESIDELESIFAPFVGVSPIDKEAYYECDKRFHRKLFDLCDNQLMRQINESMRILDRTFFAGLLRTPEETLNEHLALIQALRERNVSRSQELARLHTDVTRKKLQAANQSLCELGVDTNSISAYSAMERL